jgi:hypothetical protein
MKDTFYFHTAPVPTSRNRKYKRCTIAGLIDDSDGIPKIKFGISQCSPEDRFVKKTGRDLARIKANENPILVTHIPKDENIGKWFINESLNILKTQRIKCFITIM